MTSARVRSRTWSFIERSTYYHDFRGPRGMYIGDINNTIAVRKWGIEFAAAQREAARGDPYCTKPKIVIVFSSTRIER